MNPNLATGPAGSSIALSLKKIKINTNRVTAPYDDATDATDATGGCNAHTA